MFFKDTCDVFCMMDQLFGSGPLHWLAWLLQHEEGDACSYRSPARPREEIAADKRLERGAKDARLSDALDQDHGHLHQVGHGATPHGAAPQLHEVVLQLANHSGY